MIPDQAMTRGERNCNPGNIRRTSDRWQGMSEDQSQDKAFVVFDRPEMGIRAIGKVLLSYYREGLNTVQQIIHKWAPPVENDSGAYVRDVASRMGVSPDEKLILTDPEVLRNLTVAIIWHENGRCIYAESAIQTGVLGALA